MDRRSFFSTVMSAFGVFGLAGVFKAEAAPKVQARKGGAKTHAVFATDESLKDLPKAEGLSDNNFWGEGDKAKITTVQNFCDASIEKNPACAPTHAPGKFCGNCTFMLERSNYHGNVAGKCQLVQPQPPKTHMAG